MLYGAELSTCTGWPSRTNATLPTVAGLVSARTLSCAPTAARSTVAPSASGPTTASVAALMSVSPVTVVGGGVGMGVGVGIGVGVGTGRGVGVGIGPPLPGSAAPMLGLPLAGTGLPKKS